MGSVIKYCKLSDFEKIIEKAEKYDELMRRDNIQTSSERFQEVITRFKQNCIEAELKYGPVEPRAVKIKKVQSAPVRKPLEVEVRPKKIKKVKVIKSKKKKSMPSKLMAVFS